MRDAVICEPLRTPVGGFGGSLRDVPVQDLASTVIRALIERTGLPPESVDDVLLGNCYPTMDTPAIGRVAALDAGLPVEVRVSGEPRPLPSGIDVTAYRIVQEALTNALKHGAGGKAEVTIRYAAHALRVEVLTTGPSVLTGEAPVPAGGDGAGRGLLGLRERVAVYGGDLDARRRLGGGYRVRARIPLEAPS